MSILIFLINLIQKCRHDEVFDRAAGLTYRVLLAFFPFLVFLMALVGFMQLDMDGVMRSLYRVMPADASMVVTDFLEELSHAQSRGLLSSALFFAVYNTSNGFRAVIRCANRAYGVNDPRPMWRRVLISFGLMLLFTFSIIFMAGVLMFGADIWAYFLPYAPVVLFNVTRILGSLFILTFTTMLIYKFSCATRLRLRDVLPGAALTVAGWTVASALFGFFITNFTQYPAVYGSIAGIFILILWLNLICIILLIGNEFNALLWAQVRPDRKQFTSTRHIM
ncbi:MAG: YihY/virulence factor BrkB family protein [Defluviitaleaceae bacterium]|nr:YihY/virulence factor BrkB family protein [Defluviitaleaceae bacterium]MCL2273552.1 YihY/virulence factor BrkB family protein [Defluviitaleaceae bacterium]